MTKVGVARLAFVVIVFSALELLCRLGIITRVTMIPPSEMVASLWDIVESGRFNSFLKLGALVAGAARASKHLW
jgi:ABC-type nitrate/sulfonate/bicarbonate transport system permease component